MHITLDRPVFAVDGEVYHWADVIAHAQATGRWEELRQAARDALACEAQHGEVEEEGVDDAIEEAAAEFRYDRELVTADEMEAWLAHSGISAEEWMGHIRRTVLPVRWAGQLEDLRAEYPVTEAAIEEALRIDLACSGLGKALADEFALEAAAAAALGPAGPLLDRDAMLSDLRERASDFRRRVITPDAIAREIASNQVHWIRIDCRSIGFDDAGHVREAALCLREDGVEMDELAEDAGVEVQEEVFYLDDLGEDLHSRLLGAAEGDVIGPVEADGIYTLYQVAGKSMPTANDPELVRRAERIIVSRALAAEVGRRVRWHADSQG